MKLEKLSASTARLATAGVTAAAAIGVGLYVNGGAPLEASAVQPERETKIAPGLAKVDDLALPALPRADVPEVSFPIQMVALDVATDAPVAAMPAEEDAPILGCDIHVTASQAVAAMVNLDIMASCLPNERVVISHAGLSFSEVLDDTGALGITVPALEMDATFEVSFSNGASRSGATEVPSLQFYDRVALQWTGESGLQIHALEYGAAYGEEGHVWYGNTRDLTAVIGGQGGFMLRLGDGLSEISQMADVYTFPTGSAAADGAVELSVEAEVNGSNCGRQINASTLQIQQGSAAQTHAIDLDMPDCVATGDFLVLKNLLQDLTIAQK